MSQVLTLWNKTSPLPPGSGCSRCCSRRRRRTSRTIRPRFVEIRPNYAELVIRKRRGGAQPHRDRARDRAVQRPRGRDGRAGRGDASRPTSAGSPRAWRSATPPRRPATSPASPRPTRSSGPATTRDVPVRVRGVRDDGTVVVEGVIRLWVTDKPAASPQTRRCPSRSPPTTLTSSGFFSPTNLPLHPGRDRGQRPG